MASDTKENNVRVYMVTNQSAGALLQVQARWNLDKNSLGGYISVVLATHLSMCRRPGNSVELEALMVQLGSACNNTLAASCNRLIAMIKERRLEYYKLHRREFVPETVDEGSKSPSRSPGRGSGSAPSSPYGKYSGRLSLSAFLSAPMSEADITFALTHMIGFTGSAVVALRTVKPEPSTFSQPTPAGFRGAEEHRAACIQQRAFVGNDVFVETTRIREAPDVDIGGGKGLIGGERADGQPSAHDTGCGLVTYCLPINTYVSGLALTPENMLCYPFIIDVSSGSLPSYNGSEEENSVFQAMSRQGQGHGHHVVGLPVVLEGRRVLVVLDSQYRQASYKTEGHVYPQERILADALNYNAEGRRLPIPDDVISPTSFSHRRCKLCQVVHASDMHAEFQ